VESGKESGHAARVSKPSWRGTRNGHLVHTVAAHFGNKLRKLNCKENKVYRKASYGKLPHIECGSNVAGPLLLRSGH
jgi:hypothetical protein